MLKQGDTVEVNGITAIIETTWGQGRHTVYRLSDGREILDLHKTGIVPIRKASKPLHIDLDVLQREVENLEE